MYWVRLNGQRSGDTGYQAQQILDYGARMGWNQLIWTLVDGLGQQFDTVAHRMTIGEIAQGLLYLELREALNPKPEAS